MKKILNLILLTIFSTVFLISCKNDGNTLNVATKPMTEQYILGNILKILVEQDTNLKVKVTEGVGGGTSNIQPAIEKGDFDVYPEYTGTAWNLVLGEKSVYNEQMFDKLVEGYKKKNLTWIALLGFNDTYGLAVRKDIAKKYNLKTFTDLSKVSGELTFGAEYDFFERKDGYEALNKVYNIKFKGTVDLDIGLKYDAVKQNKIEALNIFTTDGQLATSNLVVLEDDKNLYPSYMAGFVIRNEVLVKHPELKEVFAKLNNILDYSKMAKLNNMVEEKGKAPEEVAIIFLKEKGLLK
ncbi:glycine betaine ABC transporter substrate-binding protein [Caviibacter abscessus]|uniref:glycine betaine ABC transporter substrate-binding protein n=1 Tax=Caviibacter abscessus TaxID=1766719 RepID=UPI000AFCB0BC|nr:glycine betaine ABC transporter substrate-binding protein [Caviibacter abscessus]